MDSSTDRPASSASLWVKNAMSDALDSCTSLTDERLAHLSLPVSQEQSVGSARSPRESCAGSLATLNFSPEGRSRSSRSHRISKCVLDVQLAASQTVAPLIGLRATQIGSSGGRGVDRRLVESLFGSLSAHVGSWESVPGMPAPDTLQVCLGLRCTMRSFSHLPSISPRR